MTTDETTNLSSVARYCPRCYQAPAAEDVTCRRCRTTLILPTPVRAAVPPAPRPLAAAARWLHRFGGLVILIAFFLPWGVVSCGFQDVTESGLVLSVVELKTGFGDVVMPAAPWLLLIPLFGLVALFSKRRRIQELYAVAILPSVALAITWIRIRSQFQGDSTWYSFKLLPGFFITLGGLAVLWLSALWASIRSPNEDSAPMPVDPDGIPRRPSAST